MWSPLPQFAGLKYRKSCFHQTKRQLIFPETVWNRKHQETNFKDYFLNPRKLKKPQIEEAAQEWINITRHKDSEISEFNTQLLSIPEPFFLDYR